MAHLTCVSSSEDTVRKQIELIRDAGIENILALRGDIPEETEFPMPGQFKHASDLVYQIKNIAFKKLKRNIEFKSLMDFL